MFKYKIKLNICHGKLCIQTPSKSLSPDPKTTEALSSEKPLKAIVYGRLT